MTGGEEAADAGVDRLFTLPPDEFTAERDALARKLRAGGDRDAAAAVKKLRRPTVAAWALNQVARRHRGEVDRLVEAGEALRQAQRKALSGLGGAAMRDAQQQRRGTIAALLELAAALLREHGAAPEAHTDAIRRALEAASVDEAAAGALRQGRLSQPPEAETGFGTVEGLALIPNAAPAEPTDTEAAAEAGTDEEAAEAERRAAERRTATARLATAERAAERAASTARARRRDAEEADETASRDEAEVARLSRALDTARKRAGRSREKASAAATRAEQAERAAGERDRQRDDARAALEALGRG